MLSASSEDCTDCMMGASWHLQVPRTLWDGAGAEARGVAPPGQARTTSPRMPCEGRVGVEPPRAQGSHFLVLKKKKKVAKEKKESKPQASRLGIASEPGQVIIDDE